MMKRYKPDYFDRFSCLAEACPDSCCQEWDVQVDTASADYYRSLPGQLGDRLRQVLKLEDGEYFMTIQDGRCPMWRRDGLCHIQAELGEAALCSTCRDFPRLTHDYGDFLEMGLELSCPEAARLILTAPNGPVGEEILPGGETPEYDADAMAVLKRSREKMRILLSDENRPVGETLALCLLYGVQAQSELDGAEPGPFDPVQALQTAKDLAQPAEIQEIPRFFSQLELLTREWEDRLRHPAPVPWETGHLALARYLVERYWLQAVSDYDLYSRAKWVVIACLLVKTLGGDLIRTAQLFSKEIENDADNVDAILDAAYTHPAFTDAKLMCHLLNG